MAAVMMRRAALAPLWLAVLVATACDDPVEPGFGDLQVSIVTTGEDRDLDGYVTLVDGGIRGEAVTPDTSRGVTTSATVFRGLPAGRREVEVHGVANNCAVSGENPRAVTVSVGRAVEVTFVVTCFATGVRVTTLTTGPDADADGYGIAVDSRIPVPMPVNGSVAITRLDPGTHTVILSELAANCTVGGSNPRSVTVTLRQVVSVDFVVTCRAITGSVKVTTTTTGADLDLDGYRVRLDTSSAEFIGANGTFTFVRVLDGSHKVGLDGLAPNCALSGDNPRTVTVAAGATTEVTLAVSCAALGTLQVTTATTGVDVDPDGYGVFATGASQNASGSLPANGTASLNRLVAGDYSVSLSAVTINCDVAGANPRTVTVPSGSTATVTFDVACARAPELAVALTLNGNTDIYLVKANGAGLSRLTTDIAVDSDPTWSPDGQRIAFTSTRESPSGVCCEPKIHVMSADGSNVSRLSTVPGANPAWSPDGTGVAFELRRDFYGESASEIYLAKADGTGDAVNLTNHPSHDYQPAWSSRGSLAFMSNRTGASWDDIWVMNADGSGARNLTSTPAVESTPAWSPDGTKLVFSRVTGCDYYYGCTSDLYIMNADGSGATLLTSGSFHAEAAWSPDSRWIAFTATQCDYYGCYYPAVHVVRVDGTRPTEVLAGASQPAWRP